ncbi:hypothetical protein C9374_000500 [Naegleria lovaniensis]|uniref:Leucine-rich repeat-containing protein n=1 Tax=Naegleria lovaniensis TaxID=51637 RepID=A0AA88GTX2_NAELO|nr:uncharacterized protein C9374_000500 [Naegleria lovaniensis]KAG2388336.1 hypothetical protein C9374_000500 [Naegleria lovaniensis]
MMMNTNKQQQQTPGTPTKQPTGNGNSLFYASSASPSHVVSSPQHVMLQHSQLAHHAPPMHLGILPSTTSIGGMSTLHHHPHPTGMMIQPHQPFVLGGGGGSSLEDFHHHPSTQQQNWLSNHYSSSSSPFVSGGNVVVAGNTTNHVSSSYFVQSPSAATSNSSSNMMHHHHHGRISQQQQQQQQQHSSMFNNNTQGNHHTNMINPTMITMSNTQPQQQHPSTPSNNNSANATLLGSGLSANNRPGSPHSQESSDSNNSSNGLPTINTSSLKRSTKSGGNNNNNSNNTNHNNHYYTSSSNSSSNNSNSNNNNNQSSGPPTINTSNLKRANQSRSAITPNRTHQPSQLSMNQKRRNDGAQQQQHPHGPNTIRANSVSSPTQANSNLNDVVKRTLHLRSQYLSLCDQYGVKPSQEIIRLLKVAIRNQDPLTKLSICHAQADDEHVKALVNALISFQDRNRPRKGLTSNSSTSTSSSSSSINAVTTLFDVNEILLNHNKITDIGANMIIQELLLPQSPYHKQIVSIELFGNELTDSCCELVAEMLRTNKVLKRLKLGDNKIGPEGARIIGEGLKHNQTLSQLHLGGNNVEVVGIKSIANALINNTSLTSLGLRDNGIGSDGMKALAETLKSNTQLSDIQLKGNNIKATGASFLASALMTNQSLKVLELQSNAIGPVGVKSLCQALKDNHSVHALNFNDNELGDEGALHVANLLKVNPSITTLGLASNRIRKKGAVALADALRCEQTAVTGLDLGSNEIGNGGAVALADALAVNKVLTSLDLRSCEIHLKGILALSTMCDTNTTLRHLDLGANYAKNQGAISWAQVLSKNKSLTRLCLTDNQIYHEGGEALAVGLQSNYTLRNFSYGGQGPQQNKIDSSIRRIIDSIVSENKKYWEQNQQSSEVTYESTNQMRTVDISKMRLQQQMYYNRMTDENGEEYNNEQHDDLSGSDENNLSDTLMSPSEFHSTIMSPLFPQSPAAEGKNYNSMPNWLLSSVHIPRSNVDPEEIDSKLEFIFKNKLLKAENPKFKGCYFIGNIVNTLKKVYPETRIDEGQLVQFAMNNPKYQVHLSREMVKTQMKYIGDNSEQVPKTGNISAATSNSDTPSLLPIQKKGTKSTVRTKGSELSSPSNDQYKKSVRIDTSKIGIAEASSDMNDISTSTGPTSPSDRTLSPTLNISTSFHAPLNKRALTDPGFGMVKQDSSSGLLLGQPSLMETGGLFTSFYSPLQPSSLFTSSSSGATQSNPNRTMSPFIDSTSFGMGSFAGHGTGMVGFSSMSNSSSYSMFSSPSSHLSQQPPHSSSSNLTSQFFASNTSQQGVHERQASEDSYTRYDSMVDKLVQ